MAARLRSDLPRRDEIQASIAILICRATGAPVSASIWRSASSCSGSRSIWNLVLGDIARHDTDTLLCMSTHCGDQ